MSYSIIALWVAVAMGVAKSGPEIKGICMYIKKKSVSGI